MRKLRSLSRDRRAKKGTKKLDMENVLLEGNVTGLLSFYDTGSWIQITALGLEVELSDLAWTAHHYDPLLSFPGSFYDIFFSFSKSPQMDQKKFLPIALLNRPHVLFPRLSVLILDKDKQDIWARCILGKLDGCCPDWTHYFKFILAEIGKSAAVSLYVVR